MCVSVPSSSSRRRISGAFNWCHWYVLLFTLIFLGTVRGEVALDQRDYLVRSWQSEDGLPENSATAMVQTADGYLWFGTFNGLVRFDGIRFVVFDSVNTPELTNSSVVNLYLDRSGRLWVATLGGLVVRENFRWRPVDGLSLDSGDYVRTFAERTNGDLLLTLAKGGIWEAVEGRLRELPLPPGERGAGYLGFTDEEGRWWVAQYKYVGCWDGREWQAHPEMLASVPEKYRPLGAAPAREGGFWLFVGHELRRYFRGKSVATRHVPNGNLGSISTIFEDSLGTLWIANYDAGLTEVSPTGRVRRWAEEDGIGYKDVRFVFEDRERNLWVGTSGGGLQRLKPRRFRSYGYAHGGTARLVSSVSADSRGNVWVSTFGQGLFLWEPVKDSLDRIRPPVWATNSLHFNSVLADREGRTWLGVFEDDLVCFGAGTKQHIRAREVGGQVSVLFEDSQGRVWCGAGNAVTVFEGEQTRQFRLDSGSPGGVVCALTQAQDGTIWASNRRGVFRWQGDRFELVLGSDGQPLLDVVCLHGEDKETMWMGTSGRGLLRWQAGRVRTVDETVGFPVKAVSAILEDDHGFFWMPSRQGIVRAHRSALADAASGRAMKLTCQLLDTADGLPSNDCTGLHQPICAKDPQGRLWFSSAKGVAVVNPGELQIPQTGPPVQIESFRYVVPSGIGGRTSFVVNPPFPPQLELPPGSSEIEVHYSAPNFAAPEKLTYQVMMEGRENAWQPRGSDRLERLHTLPPGHYVFRVRAADGDGVWNEIGSRLSFVVEPHFWQTVWFGLGVGTLLISSGGLAGWTWWQRKVLRALERGHLAEERHRAELETRQLREELAHSSRVSTMGQLASALAHELSQPLSAILRNAEAAQLLMRQPSPDLKEIEEILADIRTDDQRATSVISRMRALLRKHPLELKSLSLPEVVDDVVTLTRADALRRRVRLEVEFSGKLPSVRGDRIQLQQVLLNLLLNGMDAMSDQETEARQLTVRVRTLNGGSVEVAVIDRGSGLPAEQLPRLFEPFFTTKPQGLGLGLPISRSIVEAHGGRMWAENNPGGGAAFFFTLPAESEAQTS